MPAEKRHITRNRASYSCQACRRRKVKCDKEHPICGTCKKTDEECVYADEDTKAPPQHANTSTEHVRKRRQTSPYTSRDSVSHAEHGINSVNERLVEIRNLLDKINSIVDTDEAIPETLAQLNANTKVNHLALHNNGIGQSPIDALGAMRPLHDDIHNHGVDSLPDAGTASPVPGDIATSLKNISGRLNNLNLIFTGSRPDHDVSKSIPQPAGQGHGPHADGQIHNDALKASEDPSSLDLAVQAPGDGPSNVMFRGWLIWIYSVLPVVDLYEAKSKYDAFHQWYRRDFDRGVPNPAADDMPLVFAIQYGGVLGLSLRGMLRWWPELPRRLLLSSIRTHYLRSLRTTKLSYNTIAAAVMMQYMTSERLGITQATSKFSELLRNAQMLGLHRKFSPGLSTDLYLRRRRCWWEIVHLDTSHSMSANLPSLLDAQFFDDSLPSELKDFQVGTTAAQTYQESLCTGTLSPAEPDHPFDSVRASLVSVFNLMANARGIVTLSTRKISSITLSGRPIQHAELSELRALLSELGGQIETIVRRIPANGEPESASPPAPSKLGQSVAMDHGAVFGEDLAMLEIECLLGKHIDVVDPMEKPFENEIELGLRAFHKWARISLSLLLDQACCFGFGPIARDPQTPLWSILRNCAIQACHRFFRKFIMLATDLELERFRWTWTSMYNSVHPAKVLLLDLYEMPFSGDAIRSRALFDQMLSLCHAQYGIVGGDHGLTYMGPLEQAGPEIYALLIELRSKAWQKAGLDPTFLWTEHDQVQRAFDSANAQSSTTFEPGPIHGEQLKIPQLVAENSWHYHPAEYLSPFKGLNELIQRIRGSNATNAAKQRTPPANVAGFRAHQPPEDPLHQPLSNFASLSDLTNRGTALERESLTSANLQGFSTQQNASTAQRYRSNHVANRSTVADNIDQTVRSWVSGLPNQETGNDFDWERWDSLFGQPTDIASQNIGLADAMSLAEGFKQI